jgi:hypothetical protein
MLYNPKIRKMRITLGEHGSHYGADRPWSVNGHTSQGEPTTRRAPLYLTQCLLKSAITTGPPRSSPWLLFACAFTGPPLFCLAEGCPRGTGEKGIKRQNELTRYEYVNDSHSYECPFCPCQQRKYPRSGNLQRRCEIHHLISLDELHPRHVRAHHIEKGKSDPKLRQILTQRPQRSRRRRKRPP